MAPKSPNVSQKRPQSVPKVLQSAPKMNQSYPSNQHGTDMDRPGADMKPTRTSKITRKNVYFLFMDPFKWPQSDLKVIRDPKVTQSYPNDTPKSP